MSEIGKVMVVGLGEIGKPLFEVLSRSYNTIGVDIASPADSPGDVDVMHVCYPFKINDFIGQTARYIKQYNPNITVIHSTVAVGTTRTVGTQTGATVVNSPVRGKHTRMAAVSTPPTNLS